MSLDALFYRVIMVDNMVELILAGSGVFLVYLIAYTSRRDKLELKRYSERTKRPLRDLFGDDSYASNIPDGPDAPDPGPSHRHHNVSSTPHYSHYDYHPGQTQHDSGSAVHHHHDTGSSHPVDSSCGSSDSGSCGDCGGGDTGGGSGGCDF